MLADREESLYFCVAFNALSYCELATVCTQHNALKHFQREQGKEKCKQENKKSQ